MSDARIAQIKERLAKATKGPWVAFRAEAIHIESVEGHIVVDQVYEEAHEEAHLRDHDAEFIAHAPEDIAYLLSVVEAPKDQKPLCPVCGYSRNGNDFCFDRFHSEVPSPLPQVAGGDKENT